MKSRLWGILLGILIFILGAIAGAVAHILYQEHLKAAFFKAFEHPPDIVAGMARELQLDAAQTESLRKIFDESRQRYMDLSREIWPKYEAIRIETEQQIKNILREDQKILYENFLRRFQPPPPKPPPERKEGKQPRDFRPAK